MDEERTDEPTMDERRPLDAGHDAPSHPWRSADEVRGDLADETAEDRTDPDALPQSGRRREPGADVAVEDDAGRQPGEEQPTRDTGQEAGSVSEPG